MNISSGDINSVVQSRYKDDDMEFHTMTFHRENQQSKSITIFAGVSKNNSFIDRFTGKSFQKPYELLIKAINNRTVERDYFRLYSELASGIISEEDFNKELDENEDNYVIQNDIIPTMEELKIAIMLVQEIKDVNTSEDLSSLFSFNSIEIDRLLPLLNH